MESLTTVLESLDGVPEALHPFYREESGKFVLSLTDPKAHPAFVTLKATADRLDKEAREVRNELEAAKDKLAEVPDDFDADEYARLREKGEADETALEQRITERLKKRHERELEKANKRGDDAEAQLHTLLVENGLTEALTKANVAGPLMDAAKALLLRNHKPMIADGKALIDGEEIADFVKAWAETDGGQHFVASENSGGGGGGNKPGGKRVSAEANPFKVGSTFNMTEQMRITKEDPQRAERLKQEAQAA